MKSAKRLIGVLLFVFLGIAMLSAGGAKEGTTATGGGEILTFKVASITSSNPDLYEYQAGLLFTEKVEEYSNGSMKAEFYPASQLGNSTEIVESVSVGTIEVGASIGYDIYANLDQKCLVVGMPFLFKDYDHMHAFLETDNDAIAEINQSLIDNSDVRVLGYFYRPFRSVVTMRKPVYSPSDLEGLTIRSPESAVNVKWLQAVGASPVTITWSELYTSLSTGAADGAENSITEFFASNFQDIIGYCSDTDHMAVTCLLTANNTWYESLTEKQQEIIDKASQDLSDFTWKGFQEASEKAWKAFEEAGVKCIRKSEVDVEAFREASSSVYKHFVAQGYFTEDLYNRIVNLKY